jgi:hypothetical protein
MGLWERIQQALGTSGAPETARIMGLAKPSVYDWQKGKMPGLDTLIRIARMGNVSLHWLITGEGPRTIDQSQIEVSSFDNLRKTEREIIQRLAEEEGRSVQEQMSELIVEALIARGLVPNQQKAIKVILQTLEKTPQSRRYLVILELLRELSSKAFQD